MSIAAFIIDLTTNPSTTDLIVRANASPLASKPSEEQTDIESRMLGNHHRILVASPVLARAEGQGDIGPVLARLHLAARRRSTLGPDDGRARSVGAALHQFEARERIAKDAAEVVPDLFVLEAVGEDDLGLARVQAVGVVGDLEGAAACLVVPGELLRVELARVQRVRGRHLGADGPDRHGEAAAVLYDGVADARDGPRKGHSRGESFVGLAKHCCFFFPFLARVVGDWGYFLKVGNKESWSGEQKDLSVAAVQHLPLYTS